MLPMNTDFLDAHGRHLEDADYLHAGARCANANHLNALAAEYGLPHFAARTRCTTRALGAAARLATESHAQ